MKPFIISLFLLSTALHAQTVGKLSYAGSGCPKGSLTYSFAENEQDLILYYNKFLVRSGVDFKKALDRKACSLTVPISAPSGYQIALATQSMGRAIVGQNGRATLNMETFFAGSTSNKSSRVYGPGPHSVFIKNSGNTFAWSPCGQSSNLRLNLSGTTQRDGLLILRQINLKLYIRKCEV